MLLFNYVYEYNARKYLRHASTQMMHETITARHESSDVYSG